MIKRPVELALETTLRELERDLRRDPKYTLETEAMRVGTGEVYESVLRRDVQRYNSGMVAHPLIAITFPLLLIFSVIFGALTLLTTVVHDFLYRLLFGSHKRLVLDSLAGRVEVALAEAETKPENNLRKNH